MVQPSFWLAGVMVNDSAKENRDFEDPHTSFKSPVWEHWGFKYVNRTWTLDDPEWGCKLELLMQHFGQ